MIKTSFQVKVLESVVEKAQNPFPDSSHLSLLWKRLRYLGLGQESTLP